MKGIEEASISLHAPSPEGEKRNHEVEIGAAYCAPIPVRGGERSAERFINLILDSEKEYFRHINTFAEVIFNCWGFDDARTLQNRKKGKVL